MEKLDLNRPLNQNWSDEDDNHQGGVSTGIGFTISWQRGPVDEVGRNGAYLMDVLDSMIHQLQYFQQGKFECSENEQALQHLHAARDALQHRRDRRAEAGTLGTSNP